MLTAAEFQRLSATQKHAFLESLDPSEAQELLYLWHFWARPDQCIPAGDWVYWVPLAGRGWGKTRTGAETVRQWVKEARYINLIGATYDDVRDIMVEGESGILAICPKKERPRFSPSKKCLYWPNGARSLLFSADEPERLRGKQHERLWADELAAWRYPEAWDQVIFGLRLGNKPQAIVTTTPRPTKLMRDLLSDPLTYTTTGSTYDNIANLAPNFLAKVVQKYEDTRLGAQELHAKMLEDTPGALWNRTLLEQNRITRNCLPQLLRIVVAIDPAVSVSEKSDETGIIVAGIGEDQRAYVLEDVSGRYLPNEWARKAIEAYKIWQADRIIAEINNGGQMVEATIRVLDADIPFSAVHAARGKVVRAEPVSALYEQDKVRHCGFFPQLEDQMCEFTIDFDRNKAGYSPDRVDALVWAINELKIDAGAGSAVLEFYRRLQSTQTKTFDASVLRPPSGVSTAYGKSGTLYHCQMDGTMKIDPEDVETLLAAGFQKA